jgi:ferredoxin-thioredoxin reductase catalytic subunit
MYVLDAGSFYCELYLSDESSHYRKIYERELNHNKLEHNFEL